MNNQTKAVVSYEADWRMARDAWVRAVNDKREAVETANRVVTMDNCRAVARAAQEERVAYQAYATAARAVERARAA